MSARGASILGHRNPRGQFTAINPLLQTCGSGYSDGRNRTCDNLVFGPARALLVLYLLSYVAAPRR